MFSISCHMGMKNLSSTHFGKKISSMTKNRIVIVSWAWPYNQVSFDDSYKQLSSIFQYRQNLQNRHSTLTP
jgi:hypothetical protein